MLTKVMAFYYFFTVQKKIIGLKPLFDAVFIAPGLIQG